MPTEPTLVDRLPVPSSEQPIPLVPRETPEHRTRSNARELAPVDRGFGAWSFLLGAFVIESTVWAFPTAYGIFLAAYLQNPAFASQKHASSLLPLIGTLSSGIIYCSGILLYPIMARYPHYRRPVLWLGLLICWASLFGASYAERVYTLVAVQGGLYAVGGSLLYAPAISYCSEWFVEKRGLANGIIFAGTAVGGVVLPLIIPPLLRVFGISGTLKFLSIGIVVLVCPILPFIKPRLPEQRVRGPVARSTDRSWLRNKFFWMLMLVNTVQSFGYFVPTIWLPTFAAALGINASTSASALALLNGTSVVGRIFIGAISDRANSWLLAASTLCFASFSAFILWGVASHSLAGLYVFAVAYGSVAAGWSSQWSGFIRPLAKDDPALHTSIFGYMLLTRGLGNILSTPISTSMYNRTAGNASAHGEIGYDVGGGRFGEMIIYVGSCFAAASLASVVGWAMDKNRRR